MYNKQYEDIISGLSDSEQSLLVKSLNGPITTTPVIAVRMITKSLLTLYSGGSPTSYYITTDLGYEVASYIESIFTAYEEQEEDDSGIDRWRIVFEIVIPRPYGSFMSTEVFRDQIFLRDTIEARAVSTGHSIMRSRYQTASRIRAVSREAYQLPSDIDITLESFDSSD
jgi:hypothetical protein